MKTTIVSLSMLLFVGVVHAASDVEIYHGFAQGNPDLSSDVITQIPSSRHRVTDIDIYHGFAKGNPDLSSDIVTQIPYSRHRVTDNDIYHGFEVGNPDLSTDVGYEPMRTAMEPGIGDSNLGSK